MDRLVLPRKIPAPIIDFSVTVREESKTRVQVVVVLVSTANLFNAFAERGRDLALISPTCLCSTSRARFPPGERFVLLASR
jgi:hypothetical protein